ncbi:response regulator [uncultured Alteromonas sp.]|jgi:DNA-binding response OmpR family regulator|uniref:response regulator n=1 Tax=uncultured Alteromonas sp. TaxID=179113 RepID=UPI0025E57E2D|nr:response regulator [uncultured Alteromonas sp.]
MDKIPLPKAIDELKVLVVDNQALIHDLIKSALLELGVQQVSSAQNAFHAVRLCQKDTYDVVLLAFNVSSDKDGFHLFEELKHNHYISDKSTVVFLSAETSMELVNCIIELQPDDFWVKPLDANRVQQRFNYLVNIRRKLHKVMHCMDNGDYAAAIYHAERSLKDSGVVEYHPRLKRMIGECLVHLRDYATAERYFSGLKAEYDHAWVHIGLAKALFKQDKVEEAELLIEDLLQRNDTRFLTYDLLAQYYIGKEQFDVAYEQVKAASKLAPRNIERNKKLWDLARLNRDKYGQLAAVQNMAKFAKNSIHDSPELGLNVIRTMIDLAATVSGTEAEKLQRQITREVEGVTRGEFLEPGLANKMLIIKARMESLKNNKRTAEQLLTDNLQPEMAMNLEDNLDLMKAYHELGMKEECLVILDTLRTQLAGDTLASQVVDEYLKREEIERREIKFTTKELKEMAAVNYRENRIIPAYNNLCQAMTLSPHDKSIALSLLKVLVQINKTEPLSDSQYEVAVNAADLLGKAALPANQQQKRDEYLSALSLNENTVPATPE